jgi:hypothetical protein
MAVLGDVHARLMELMEDVEHIHGISAPGSPWLLLCRGSNILFAWSPSSYEGPYVDLIDRYRKAADTTMAIKAAAGGAQRNIYDKTASQPSNGAGEQADDDPSLPVPRDHRESMESRGKAGSWQPPFGRIGDTILIPDPSSQP